jgi:general secretion pathway protein G
MHPQIHFRANRGVSLLELSIIVAVVGLLAAIAIPVYSNAVEKSKVKRAVADMLTIRLAIERKRSDDGVFPNSLAGISGLPLVDPWGKAYVYNYFKSPGFNTSRIRKDHNLHPLNTEFDLYSEGCDGDTRPPLTARPSRDDVIVAHDGSFVGLAKDF